MSEAVDIPALEDLAAAVREGLGLHPETDVEVSEVTEHSNFNYVYRASVEGVAVYLKVAAARPKRFPIPLPRRRLFAEAEAIHRFGELCGDGIRVPDVLFLDRQRFVLGLTDVGEGRDVLLGLLPQGYDLLVEQAAALGGALARVHRGTRGSSAFRPPEEDALVRRVIYEGLLAPGAKGLFPHLWDEVWQEMSTSRECLVHADLWSKNLLVAPGRPLAVVDFEGAHLGDPAFDLATLLAAALIPVLDDPGLAPRCRELIGSLRDGYLRGSGRPQWAEGALTRAYRFTGTFLAARGFGPFAYEMSTFGRLRLAALAVVLTAEPPPDAAVFQRRIAEALRRRRVAAELAAPR